MHAGRMCGRSTGCGDQVFTRVSATSPLRTGLARDSMHASEPRIPGSWQFGGKDPGHYAEVESHPKIAKGAILGWGTRRFTKDELKLQLPDFLPSEFLSKVL